MLWSLIVWVVFGFVVGLIARAIMPGKQSMSFLQTTALGVAGSFVGGLLATVLFGGHLSMRGLSTLHTSGFVGSVLGALVLMFVVGLVRRAQKKK